MKRTHLSVVIVLSIILLIAAGTLSVSSEPVPEKEKTNEELVQEIRQEFAIFMKEYRTHRRPESHPQGRTGDGGKDR